VWPAGEWKIVNVRETCPPNLADCKVPSDAVAYWRSHVAKGQLFNPDVECFVVLLLNTKHRIRGHHLVSIGSLNETIAHPREVFRAAVIGAAYGVVLMHNHPSGDPNPSDADRRMTKALCESGQILRIAVMDHVVVGEEQHFSFREAGLL
jgi:DNA repair protein RadC